ncbi:MAG: NUDIX domain-containing protein [Polaromonas sp.]|nr:NUDIX domain-containing protein [Polaromonas sp.]
MDLNSDLVTGLARPAATVILLRDGTRGLEVFLLKRHSLSDVLGGVFVFPGGKVDPLDAELDKAAFLDQSPADLHSALNEPDISHATAAGLYVAAVREVFEESGVLFAGGATLAHAMRATALASKGLAFDAVLSRLQLRLQTRSLTPWSRWITPTLPSVTNKRFDTRFFVAAVPPGQIAKHDNFEATDSCWLAPRNALEQYRDGNIMLAPPQIMTLAHLARYSTVQQALFEARSRRPPAIRPEPLELDGYRVLCYPGDERHSVKERAMPGPTRLWFRGGKFEPPEGFEALLG